MLAVVTALDVGKRKKGKFNTANLFGGDEVQHYHQAIAVVVAETFEQARAASALIKVDYAEEKGVFDLRRRWTPRSSRSRNEPDSAVGDFEGAFKAAAVVLDETYTTPDQSHSMMEPHASIAAWDGDELTVWTSSQMIDWWRTDLATTLDVDKEKIHLMSPFIGGGFGGKLFLRADAVLAAFAARAARRPVKVALPRPFLDEQHDPPTSDHPAHSYRCRARRQDHRDCARKLVGRPCRAEDSNCRHADPAALRWSEPDDGDAAGDARSSGGQRHARARRGTWPDGA